ncbi:RES family NAD+ phosphorylase [Marinimicrobium sp. ABcell2]|uniref:RES family NAD+ phosphorylase n=1 Tax=Marinimicrobium sp. ABcell2 TaxID=3069751 RepID=UPI0027AE2D0C|nr:RES family NAD+ phosphorylase [Marinimicrobium sp. ABcell2]MDQ2077791.1 RES family NAD+ phosphorylase [Marinimicrobium sp. ABcell2]
MKLPKITIDQPKAYRLVSSRYPPIDLFEDVASAEDFDALYQLQARTNPRLLTQAGDLNLIPRTDIPWGISGCSYAVAPFTHVNPEGSRFSDGQFGVLYLAESMETAIKEVRYHQGRYLAGVEGLKYDRLVFRGLRCSFAATPMTDATKLSLDHPIYDPEDYTESRTLGTKLKKAGDQGLAYRSVRDPGATCWGLFTPSGVRRVVQAAHYEFIWNGSSISSASKITLQES